MHNLCSFQAVLEDARGGGPHGCETDPGHPENITPPPPLPKKSARFFAPLGICRSHSWLTLDVSRCSKDDIMEGRESPLSCYFVDHAQPPQKFNTDNPNLRGTPCDPNGLRPSQLYTFNQRDLRDDESTQTKALCAFCGETARAAHTITVRLHRPRPGGAGAAATARASLAVKRPTRWCDLRCPAHPVPPGRGARRAPPPPTARRKEPCACRSPSSTAERRDRRGVGTKHEKAK